VGGGIEFGERAADAVVREFAEELGSAVDVVRLLGVVDNIFTYEGRPGHEILFLFEVEFADTRLYTRRDWTLADSHGSRATWRPLAELAAGPPVYPREAVDLIQTEKPPTTTPAAAS
jgi:ADP-ribose pyrophosphatase YjhB (NUDIX family)